MPESTMLELGYDINPISLDNMVLRRWPNKELTRHKDHHINGLDTETLDGYCKLIADDRGNTLEPDNIEDILEFLTQRRFRSASNFFYNIRFDYQSILKYLDKEDLLELYASSKIMYNDYRIKYIPKRLLSITRSKNVHRFFDLAQFYEMSLEKAAQKYTKRTKNEDNLDAAQIGVSAQYWADHHKDIVKYCIQDAAIAADLGVLLRDTLVNKIGMLPQSYISKAGLSKEYFRRNCAIPNIQDIPRGALGIFLNAYSAGRFEVLRKGFIPNCWAIDINSAYSKAITLLPDVTKGVWKKVNRYTGKAVVGCYLCKIESFNTIAAPHRYRLTKDLVVYPTGSYWTYLTNWEIEVMKEDAHIQVSRGWEFYANDILYPFKDRILLLYKLKQRTPKSEYEYDLYKKIMNSLYGSFYEKIEQNGKFYSGKLFNPIYASLITAYCRLTVWQVMRDYLDYVVSVATDGIILDKKPNVKYSKNLGEWSIEGQGDVVIIRSGLYRIGDKIRERGIRSFKGIKTEYGDYDDIFEYIQDKPQRKCYPIISNRPLNLGECLVHTHTKSIEDLNVFVDQRYTVTINRDLKRMWDDTFINGGEVFEKQITSKPLLINV